MGGDLFAYLKYLRNPGTGLKCDHHYALPTYERNAAAQRNCAIFAMPYKVFLQVCHRS